jgi:hypothetical protein
LRDTALDACTSQSVHRSPAITHEKHWSYLVK